MKQDKCHKHDLVWADELIDTLPKGLHLKVCRAYCVAYQAAFDAEPIDHKKQGAARVEANTRLRKFVDKHIKSTKNNWSFTP